ncbi:MAG: SDR family oxidoreductase [Bacteroidales bacterium]|nr:SDR family oxidoreductase [Bacteroidales bacterium]
MDLRIKDRYFLVGGAGSGFGKSVSLALAAEGAKVLAVSRTKEKLESLKSLFPENIEVLPADLSDLRVHQEIENYFISKPLAGIFVNAGGPPAGGAFDVTMEQWDMAWNVVVRWKIALVQRLIPLMEQNHYGRILFLESVSVKQPVPNLILSNSLRPAVVGYAKTLSQEVASIGITVNVIAPGFHETAAMDRIFKKKMELEGITEEKAKESFTREIPMGTMGNPDDLASLSAWLLSPHSTYVTGQTIAHTGGSDKGLL